MTDTFAADLLELEGRSFADAFEALLEAQEFSGEHQVKMYVLREEDGTFRISDQYDDERQIEDEALPEPQG